VIGNELIKRCLQEDQRAQSELYRQLYNVLIGVCWRYASNKEQAIEYMNLGFVRILLNLKRYKEYVPFELWAKRVTINTIFNEFKKNKAWAKRNDVVDEHELVIKEKGENEFFDHQEELMDMVKKKVLQLPPMTAKVFNLYAVDGYMHNEIAQMLGISEGTSMWHYSEAKKKIKIMLGILPPTDKNAK